MTNETPQPAPESAHQRILVKTGTLWACAIGLATIIVVSMGLMRAFELALSKGSPLVHPNEVTQQLGLISRMAPLNPQQRAQRERYEMQQEELLSSYGWLDKKQNLARIPVKKAMTLIVQQYRNAE